MKSELVDIQHWMQASLIDPGVNSDLQMINTHITEVEHMETKDRLAIYQRSYYARLIECMRNQFKALVYTLEDGLFEEFCRMYLRAYPSQDPSLSPLGARFPQFLEEIRPDKEQPERWIDFMIAMAQFELDLYLIFDKEGAEEKGYADAHVTNEKLQLQPCFSVHQYPFRVNTYYQEIAQGNSPEITPPEETYVAFVRVNYQVFVIELQEKQYQLLEHILKTGYIRTGLNGFINQYNLDPERVETKWEEWKKDWINKGFFIENNETKIG